MMAVQKLETENHRLKRILEQRAKAINNLYKNLNFNDWMFNQMWIFLHIFKETAIERSDS